MARVSVVIPAYNQGTLLRRAVESVVAQSFGDWEIVLVDDGSSDDTPAVARELSRRIPALRHIRQENAGRSAARNAGLSVAEGDYLVFLDADDWLLPDKLAFQVSYLDDHPETGVVYSDVMLCDEQERVLQAFSLNEGRRHPSGDVFEHLLPANFVTMHSAMVRRYCIEEAGGFAEDLQAMEDWEFFLRVAHRWHFYYMSEPTACYRVHAGMTTRDPARVLGPSVAAREKIRHQPFFAAASPAARRNFYCSYGILHMGIGDVREGRRMFWRAIAEAPASLRPHVLLALSLLGRRGFGAIANAKRWLSRLIGRRAASPLPHFW